MLKSQHNARPLVVTLRAKKYTAPRNIFQN
jgi:hypothetical protein